MNWLEALILGIVQGLTEFLPISSSGHLEIGKVLLGIESERSMIFTVVVHGATVASTIVVFFKDIVHLFRGVFSFKWNDQTRYVTLIIISMLPVGIVGAFFKEDIEQLFEGNLFFVGSMLLITAGLLALPRLFKPGEKKPNIFTALFMGIMQALAVLPGISRSGATISAGLMLKNNREEIARFSFLMVLIPIIGANILDIFSKESISNENINTLALAIGFAAAFITGLLACKLMIAIVKKGKLIWFSVYCFIIGTGAIIYALTT